MSTANKLGTLKQIKHLTTVVDHRTSDLRVATKVEALDPKLQRLAINRRLHELAPHATIHAEAAAMGYKSTADMPLDEFTALLQRFESIVRHVA